jgi:hypothetical protein
MGTRGRVLQPPKLIAMSRWGPCWHGHRYMHASPGGNQNNGFLCDTRTTFSNSTYSIGGEVSLSIKWRVMRDISYSRQRQITLESFSYALSCHIHHVPHLEDLVNLQLLPWTVFAHLFELRHPSIACQDMALIIFTDCQHQARSL